MADSLRRRMMMGQSGDGSYENQYFTFVARASGTFSFTNSIYYSLNKGVSWVSLSANTATPTVGANEKIMWRASGITPRNATQSNPGIGQFSATASFDVEGNIMSLCEGSDFRGKTTILNNQFASLFNGCTQLISAENLVLPADDVANNGYRGMFHNCSNLEIAPYELPATTLGTYSYSEMFGGCTSLVTAPKFSPTTLGDHCCYRMFQYCASLTNVPDELPATSLATYCYNAMFYDCTALMHAPKLPATTLQANCYNSMFYGCTSLVAAPILQAGTLVSNCYNQMFYGCSSLYNVTCWADSQSIPSGALTNWLYGVKSGGCFIAKAMGANYPSGASGVPSNWHLEYMHGIIYDLSGYYTYKNDAINTGIKLFSYDTVHGWNASYRIDLEATVIETPSSYNTFISCGNLDIYLSSTYFYFVCEPFFDYNDNYGSIGAGSKISAVAEIEDNPDDTSYAGYQTYTQGSYAGGASISVEDVNDSYESESVLRIGNSSIKVIIHYFRIYEL